jgi:hypothetical protein
MSRLKSTACCEKAEETTASPAKTGKASENCRGVIIRITRQLLPPTRDLVYPRIVDDGPPFFNAESGIRRHEKRRSLSPFCASCAQEAPCIVRRPRAAKISGQLDPSRTHFTPAILQGATRRESASDLRKASANQWRWTSYLEKHARGFYHYSWVTEGQDGTLHGANTFFRWRQSHEPCCDQGGLGPIAMRCCESGLSWGGINSRG